MQGVGFSKIQLPEFFSNPRRAISLDISSVISKINGNFIKQILNPAIRDDFFPKESSTVDQLGYPCLKNL